MPAGSPGLLQFLAPDPLALNPTPSRLHSYQGMGTRVVFLKPARSVQLRGLGGSPAWWLGLESPHCRVSRALPLMAPWPAWVLSLEPQFVHCKIELIVFFSLYRTVVRTKCIGIPKLLENSLMPSKYGLLLLELLIHIWNSVHCFMGILSSM